MKKNKELVFKSVYVIYFVLFLYIFWKVPYCHDEWAWGLPDRIELMKNGFEGYNGRYLGNLLAILITRSLWAKTGILALVMLALLTVMMKVVREDQKTEFWQLFGVVFFLLALPQTLFQQTYGWAAAFVNFIPPVVIFLLYVIVVSPFEERQTGRTETICMVSILPLCVAGQLFSEHNSIFHLLFAGIVLAYGIFRYKKVRWQDLCPFLAFALGAALMFSNSAYGNAASDLDGYKQIRFSIGTMVQCYVDRMSDSMLLNNWILNVCIAGVLIDLIARKKTKKTISTEVILVLTGYAAFGVWHRVNPDWRFLGNEFYDDCVRAALGILFVFHVLAAVFLYTEGKARRRTMLWYISALAVSGPLLMANPIGARCFYVSYIFQVLACMELLKYRNRNRTDTYQIGVALMGMCLVLAVVYAWMFREIGRYNIVRGQIIEEARATDKKEIALPLLPYPDYTWTTEPPTATWEKRFKQFYNLPQDVKIQFYDTGF